MELEFAEDIKIPPIISKAEIDAKAEENRTKRELPKKPGEVVSFKELCEWLALLTPDMTDGNRVVLYIYRLDPVIIRQMANPDLDNNIDVVSDGFESFTDQYFIERHGGGKFQIVVKDLDKPKTQKGGYFKANFYLPISQYPPKINDLREVDWEHKTNKGYRAWCKAQGLIDEKGMPVELKAKEGANNAPMNDTVVQMMKMVMDYTTKMNDTEQRQFKKQIGGDDALTKSIGDILLEKMKQDDPNKQLTALVSIMSAMKGMTPEVKPDNTLAVIMPMFMQMMTSQMESSKQQFTMMLELMRTKNEGGEAKSNSTIGELKEAFTMFQEMSGGGSKKSTAEVVGEIVSNNLTPVLGIISNVVAMRAAQTPGTIPPTSNTTSQPNTQQQPSQPETNTKPAMIQPSEAVNVINQFKPIILNKLSGEGWEFGAWIAEGFGDMTAASITKYGVDGLMDAAKMVPDFWQQVQQSYGEEKLKEWITSFVNYKQIIKDMDEAEAGEVQE